MVNEVLNGIKQFMPQLYKLQSDAVISQASPSTGNKYTVLDTTLKVRIYGVNIVVTWTVQPDPLEVHLTIDGISIAHSFTNPVSTTNYIVVVAPWLAANAMTLATWDAAYGRNFLYEGQSIKVEAETTGGTVSNLSCRVKYGKII